LQKLLEQMIEDLARMGYLRPLAGDCQGRCSDCPLAGSLPPAIAVVAGMMRGGFGWYLVGKRKC